MNENRDHSPLSLADLPDSKSVLGVAKKKKPQGRVPHILADQQALEEWQHNLAKLREKDTQSAGPSAPAQG